MTERVGATLSQPDKYVTLKVRLILVILICQIHGIEFMLGGKMRDVITDAVTKFATLVRTPAEITPEIIAKIQGPLGQCTTPCKLGRVDLSQADLCQTPCIKGFISPSAVLDSGEWPIGSQNTDVVKVTNRTIKASGQKFVEFEKPGAMNTLDMRMLNDDQFQVVTSHEWIQRGNEKPPKPDLIRIPVSSFSYNYVIRDTFRTWFLSVDDVDHGDVIFLSKDPLGSLTFPSENEALFYESCEAAILQYDLLNDPDDFILKNCQHLRIILRASNGTYRRLQMFKKVLPNRTALAATKDLRCIF